jgi:hypothetical protein
MFGSWLNGIQLKLKELFCVGLTAMSWSIWLNRNDMVFNRSKPNTFMQVIFGATYWTRTWSLLFKDKDVRANLKNACRLLETVVMEVYANFRWKFSNKITA